MDQHRRCEMFLISPMYRRILLKILLIAITTTLTSSNVTPSTPSCRNITNDFTQCACEQHETFSISCANNQIILISNAFYGRFDNITCNGGDRTYWNLSCISQNSTKVVSERCNNQTHCSIGKRRYNSLFGDPCLGTGKYLLVNYTCVPDESYTSSVATEPASLTPTSQSAKASTERSKSSTGASYTSSVDTEPASLTPTIQSAKTSTKESKRSTDASYTTSVDVEPASLTPTSQSTKAATEESKISTADVSSVHSTDQTATTTINSGCSCSIEQLKNITWQNTDCGSNRTLICPNNNNSEKAYRWCSKDGTWSDPNLKGCTSEEIKQFSKESESLRENFTVSAANEMMTRVESFSKSNDLRGGDLFELTDVMVQFVQLSQNNSNCFTMSDAEDFSNLVLSSTSNLLESDGAWEELSPSDQSITATQLLVGMEDSLAVLAAATNTTNTTKKGAPGIDDVQIDVKNISEANLKTPITLSVDARSSSANGSNNGAQLKHTHDVQLELSLEDVKNRSSGDGLGRVVFILYNDIEKRLKTTSKNDSLENDKTAENSSYIEPSIITKVVSVSIISDKERSKDLINPIKFTLHHKSHPRLSDAEGKIVAIVKTTSCYALNDGEEEKRRFVCLSVDSVTCVSIALVRLKLFAFVSWQLNSSSMSCVFWKFSKGDFVGKWSSEGCKVVSANEHNTTCECSHLTNFAVLMSTTNKTISHSHRLALQMLTNIGCAISIVCLALALFIFCFFRNLQSDRNTIHKNLVFSLLIAELIFVFGIIPYKDQNQDQYQTVCAVVAGFLHYFFLASFAWMCLEGVQLYILLIEVFETEKSRVKWYYLGGYGIPALIVLISACANISIISKQYPYGGYGTKEYCWLNKDMNFVWAFNGPVIAVFVINLVMLGLAIYVMCKHASAASAKLKEKSKIYKIGSWLRGAAILVVLLGTTWIFGIFLIFDKETLFFEYVFTILNSLQGLFIFVFHCLINEKVQHEFQRAIQRSSWLPECVRVKFRDWGESGSSSFTSQSTSSGKQSKRRESTMSDSSLKKLVSTPSDNSVRVTLSSTQEETWPRKESTCLTDSSGYSDHLESSEDLRGYRDSVISCVNEGRFNVQHQIE